MTAPCLRYNRLYTSDKTIVILGDRWWPEKAKEEGGKVGKRFLCSIRKQKNAMSAHMLEASLLGVGMVLHLEDDAWSMVKPLRQATNEYPPPPHPALLSVQNA